MLTICSNTMDTLFGASKILFLISAFGWSAQDNIADREKVAHGSSGFPSDDAAIHFNVWTLEMFLDQKMDERKWIGQRSHSKQRLFSPRFFLSIPAFNGLSDRSKPVQRFTHTDSHRFSTVFNLFGSSNLSKGQIPSFLTKFNRILSKLFNVVLLLQIFFSTGRVFLSSPPIDYDWTGLHGETRLEWSCDFSRLSLFKCSP